MIELIEDNLREVTEAEFQAKIENDDFDFSDSIFNFKVSFENIDLSDVVLGFCNCKFNRKLNLKGANLLGLEIALCQFNDTCDLEEITLNSNTLTLTNVETNSILKLNRAKLQSGIHLDRCFFNHHVYAKEIESDIGAECSNGISECNFSKGFEFDFSDSTFHTELLIYSSEFNKVNAKKCNFQSNLRMHNNTFHSNMYFEKSHFRKQIDCMNLKFNQMVFFGYSEMDDVCTFHYCTFESASFSGASLSDFQIISSTIEKRISFNHVKIRNKLILNDTTFSAVHFSGIHGYDGKGNTLQSIVMMKSITVKDHLFFDINHIYELVLEACNIASASFQGTEIEVANSQTLRQIKALFLKANNKIDALKFYSLEMDQYRKEILPNLKPPDLVYWRKGFPKALKPLIDSAEKIVFVLRILYRWIRNSFFDWFLLLLNYYSNKHGLRWSWGVRFTIISATLIFSIKMWLTDHNLCFSNDCIEYFLSRLLYFIYPLREFSFPAQEAKSSIILVDIIGRIAIGYGVYQTIAAFRKHRF